MQVQVQKKLLFWLTALLVLTIAVITLNKVLLPFIAGLIMAYALNPIADRLCALGLPRVVASALVVALLVLAFVLALVFLLPLILTQAQQFLSALPTELDRLKGLAEGWARAHFGDRFAELEAALDKRLAEMAGQGASMAGFLAQSLWNQGRALVDFMSLLLITPLVVFYLLVDWNAIFARIDSWLPRDHRDTIHRLASEIDRAIAAFIRGQGLVCLILGTVYAVGLSVVGLRYGLLIGIVTGILAFVPIVGWAVGLVTASILALVQGWPDMTLFAKVFGVFLLGQVLDAGVLSPKIVGSSIGLHPVGLIFALILFSSLFGFVGVLVAVPLAAAAMVLMRFALQLYLASDIYRGSGDTGGAAP